jgi:Protein of unknown function (DUF3489)
MSKSKSAKKPASQAKLPQAMASLPQPGPNADGLRRDNSTSKQSCVIAMQRSPAGATIAAMMKATDWQPHSVRGFLAGVVRKRLKLRLDSANVDGTRVYRIVGEGSIKPRREKATRLSS